MPKFIGRTISGATDIGENRRESSERMRLSYSQARLMPPNLVSYSLDTTDKGSAGSYAKRWYRWFANPYAVLACPTATPKMREKAEKHIQRVAKQGI